jgi:hypothetical protein
MILTWCRIMFKPREHQCSSHIFPPSHAPAILSPKVSVSDARALVVQHTLAAQHSTNTSPGTRPAPIPRLSLLLLALPMRRQIPISPIMRVCPIFNPSHYTHV